MYIFQGKQSKTLKINDHSKNKTVKLEKLGTENSYSKEKQKSMEEILLKYEIIYKKGFKEITPKKLWYMKNENNENFAIIKGDISCVKSFHTCKYKNTPMFLEVIDEENQLSLLSLKESIECNLDKILEEDTLLSFKLIDKLLDELEHYELNKIVLANLSPKLIGITSNKNITIFYPFEIKKEGEELRESYFDSFSPPEVYLKKPLRLNTVSYIVAAMLYKVIFKTGLPEPDTRTFHNISEKINKPLVLQLLYESLQDDPDNRYVSVLVLKQSLLSLIAYMEQEKVKIEHSSKVTIGKNRRRKKNQDSIGSYITEDYFENIQITKAFFCVADGMGGGISGELASKTAVNKVKNKIIQNVDIVENYNELLKEAIIEADKAVIDLRKKMIGEKKEMGTTFSSILIIKNKMYMGHVGDSRIYHFKEGELKQITKDHSFVQVLVDKKEITKDQARVHPNKNIITKSVGSGNLKKDEVYSFENTEKTPFIELKDEGYILLCSDGIWEGLGDQKIKEIVKVSIEKKETLEQMNEKITKTALDLDGSDNTSCIIIKYKINKYESKDLVNYFS